MKGYSYLTVVIFVFCLTGNIKAAQPNWQNFTGDHLYTTGANWSLGVVPASTDDPGIIKGGNANYCLINNTMSVTVARMRVGVVNNNACELRITGGSLHDSNDLFIGIWAGCDGSSITQSGGSVTVDANLYVGNQSSSCAYYLQNGTLSVGGNVSVDNAGITTNGVIDISYGTLTLTGDKRTAIQQLVNNHKLIAFSGSGTVVINLVGGNTQVTALAPPQASNPYPANNATGVVTTDVSNLTWLPGGGAVSHNVYFGTNYDAVNDANTGSTGIYLGNTDTASYPCPTLNAGTFYYWRVDEVNGSNVVKGNVWTFSTVPTTVSWINYDLNNDWNDVENWNPYPQPNPPDSTCDVQVVWGGSNQCEIFSGTNAECFKLRVGVNGNPSSQMTINGGNLSVLTDVVIGVWSGCNNSTLGTSNGGSLYVNGNLRVGLLSSFCHLRIDGGTVTVKGGMTFPTDSRAEIRKDGKLVLVGDRVNTVNNWINHGNLRGDAYVALIDGNTVVTTQYGDPNSAWGPYPAHGETLRGSGLTSLTLTWLRGDNATNWNVYFGTDFNDVNNATTATGGIYKGNVPNPPYTTDPNYAISGLSYGSTYYWRIDAIDQDSVVTKGNVWAFRIVEQIDWNEVRMMSEQWLNCNCAKNNVWCYSANYDHDGKVEFDDFSTMASNWVNVP